MNDWFGLAISYIYIFSILAAAELLRRWRGYSSNFTRKFVHIGVGMLSWMVPFLFDSPWLFVIACVSFMIINLADWRYGIFSSMNISDRSNLGTVYFPLAAGLVAIIFWDYPPLLVGALMPLTWGDGLASVIGQKYGARTYSVLGKTRSIEGSLTFFVMGGFFTWLALWLMPGPPEISQFEALAPTAVVLLATTLTEAITPWGLDNLTVTAVSVFILSSWYL